MFLKCCSQLWPGKHALIPQAHFTISVFAILVLADLYNVAVCPHGFRIGPALYANIHWALSQMNMEWLEIPFLPDGFAFSSGVPMPKMVNGQVYLPDAPGLGIP